MACVWQGAASLPSWTGAPSPSMWPPALCPALPSAQCQAQAQGTGPRRVLFARGLVWQAVP